MPHRQSDLATLLTELKDRSGLSYALIGQKVNLSKSAVHRFIAGQAAPHDFGTVERIARACGADRGELDRLYPLWTAAVSQQPVDKDLPKADETVTQDAAAAPEQPAETGQPAGTMPEAPVVQKKNTARRWRVAALVVAALALIASGALVTAQLRGDEPKSTPPTVAATPQWISGPSWTLPARPVPAEYFGVTLNSATGHMPGFTTGAVRLWDSETRWSLVQPERDRFDWEILDRLVAGAQSDGLPVLFVIGGTPGWAAPGGKKSVYPDDARTAPPDDLTVWDGYISALVGRYTGRISAYELWVFANDTRMYTGSVETLVEMTKRASVIIRAADPKATIVCPGMGNLWNTEGQTILRKFAQLGGYEHCDAAGIKLHQRSPEDPPETMLELTAQIDRIFHDVGVHPPLWNTGTTYAIPLQGQLDRAKARDHAVRFFLMGLLARTTNLDRMYFYNWGGTKIPIVLQADEGEPTEAALAVQELQRWVVGSQIRSCGHGQAMELPQYVWQCEFVVPTAGGQRRAVIRWTHAQDVAMRAEAGVETVRRLDGTSAPAAAGDEIILTKTPILIQYYM